MEVVSYPASMACGLCGYLMFGERKSTRHAVVSCQKSDCPEYEKVYRLPATVTPLELDA